MRVAVVVLGEIGQSPRMLYHVNALVAHGADVDLVAYAGDATPAALRSDAAISLHPIASPGLANRHQMPRPLFLLYALFRQFFVLLRLIWILTIRVRRPDLILMQTPPAIPAMAVCWIAARLRSAQYAIDWHNYGYTILSLRFGASHGVVRLARLWERWFGQRADLHFCVSSTMRDDLMQNWGIAAPTVFYDRPADRFFPLSAEDRNVALRSLIDCVSDPAEVLAALSTDRSAMLVSPTSWTADEDFSLLFDALALCDTRIKTEEQAAGTKLYPDVVVLLTGRGPLREFYEERAASLSESHIHVVFAWLPSDLYGSALGLADLGLCFHTSSSGLDLPMKIADMQGVGLPVCAYDYGPCLTEMITQEETGLLFTDGKQLADHICGLLRGFSRGDGPLANMKDTIMTRHHRRWGDEWAEIVAPVIGLNRRGNPTQ